MMQMMSPDDIAGVQRGMAERPDSVATCKTIDVPALADRGRRRQRAYPRRSLCGRTFVAAACR